MRISTHIERSGTQLLSLCAEPRGAQTGPAHRHSFLVLRCCHQSASVGQRKLGGKSIPRLTQTPRGCGGEPGPCDHWTSEFVLVSEELVYDPRFCTFLLATLDLLGSTEGSGVSGQVVLSLGAAVLPLLISRRFDRSEDTSRTHGAACSFFEENRWNDLFVSEFTVPVLPYKRPGCSQ